MINNFEKKVRVIGYDDDNHGIRIFVNGIYIDNMDNGVAAAKHLIAAGMICQNDNIDEIITKDIYYCNLGISEEMAAKVDRILCEAMQLTPEQELALLNEDYKKLILL